jgi:hypothetical protein
VYFGKPIDTRMLSGTVWPASAKRGRSSATACSSEAWRTALLASFKRYVKHLPMLVLVALASVLEVRDVRDLNPHFLRSFPFSRFTKGARA